MNRSEPEFLSVQSDWVYLNELVATIKWEESKETENKGTNTLH